MMALVILALIFAAGFVSGFLVRAHLSHKHRDQYLRSSARYYH
jgi:hypothetical protein